MPLKIKFSPFSCSAEMTWLHPTCHKYPIYMFFRDLKTSKGWNDLLSHKKVLREKHIKRQNKFVGELFYSVVPCVLDERSVLFFKCKNPCINSASLCVGCISAEKVTHRAVGDRRRHTGLRQVCGFLSETLSPPESWTGKRSAPQEAGRREEISEERSRKKLRSLILLYVLTAVLCVGPVHGVICVATLRNSLQAKVKRKHIPTCDMSFCYPQWIERWFLSFQIFFYFLHKVWMNQLLNCVVGCIRRSIATRLPPFEGSSK